jgi:serine/threonine-protein kinase CAK1
MELKKRYTKIKRIYSGPYSDVYEGKDEVTQVAVALKVVDIDITIKPHNIKQEIEILQKLSHKGVLECIATFEDVEDVYLVTPLFRYNLDQLLQAKYTRRTTKFNLQDMTNNSISVRSTISNSTIESFLVPLVDSVRYLHENGIIHRDLKPTNIYFAEDDISKPVIGDFGISYDTNSQRQMTSEDPKSKYTDVCSKLYKPPELCFGVTDYGVEIDIWSLGIIFTVIYSSNFKSILENYDVFNDLSLINGIFQCFGTPYVAPGPDGDPLYWPQMNDGEKYHFKAFEFVRYPRKLPQELLPRCDNDVVLGLFDRMMVYQSDRRLTSKALNHVLTEWKAQDTESVQQ